MHAEQYLNQAYKLNERIEDKKKRLADMQALAYSTSGIDYSKDRVQGGALPEAPFTNAIINAVDYEAALKRELMRLEQLKVEIGQAIDAVEDVNCSLVLSKKYVLMETWEKIAEEMKYSVSQVQRIHKKALKIFKVPEKMI